MSTVCRRRVEQVAHEEILTYQEIVNCQAVAGWGYREVKIDWRRSRFTQGPYSLVKRTEEMRRHRAGDADDQWRRIKSQMEELAKAGLDAVNISLIRWTLSCNTLSCQDMLDQATGRT